MTRESLVERRLARAVVAAGGVAYKFTSPSRNGVPDRVCVFPGGRICFAEVKAPGGRLSELQKVEIAQIRARDVQVFVVWDQDGIDEVVAWGVN